MPPSNMAAAALVRAPAAGQLAAVSGVSMPATLVRAPAARQATIKMVEPYEVVDELDVQAVEVGLWITDEKMIRGYRIANLGADGSMTLHIYSVIDFIVETVPDADRSYASTFWSRLLRKKRDVRDAQDWYEDSCNLVRDVNGEREVTPCVTMRGLTGLVLAISKKLPVSVLGNLFHHLNQVIDREEELVCTHDMYIYTEADRDLLEEAFWLAVGKN
jgi:hypothetical protein